MREKADAFFIFACVLCDYNIMAVSYSSQTEFCFAKNPTQMGPFSGALIEVLV